ncbi:unnamed protein product [Sphagnum tenellum]
MYSRAELDSTSYIVSSSGRHLIWQPCQRQLELTRNVTLHSLTQRRKEQNAVEDDKREQFIQPHLLFVMSEWSLIVICALLGIDTQRVCQFAARCSLQRWILQ